MQTLSPSRTRANAPPSAASGVTCPTMIPWEAPEKRPSVTRATSLACVVVCCVWTVCVQCVQCVRACRYAVRQEC
jgi:hypothetical protein